MPYDRKYTRYEIDGEERAMPVTVGVEMETEFRRRRFDVYCYLEPGFDMWYASTDCTLLSQNSEVQSPILQGVGGLAEIIGTAEILQNETGYMDERCGQHTTVGDPRAASRNINWQRRMRNLFFALEEGMYAFTGDMGRMFRGYGNALKPSGGDGIRSRGDTVMEMRYPPGTLVPEQIAVNVGLCQMLAMFATESRLNVTRDMRNEAQSIFNNSGANASRYDSYGERVSRENLDFALSFLKDHGWGLTGGDFRGLPYDPDVQTTVVLLDDPQKGEYEVTLPNRSQLEAHMRNMLAKFCADAAIAKSELTVS